MLINEIISDTELLDLTEVLRNIKHNFKNYLNEFVNKCNSIQLACKSNGSGSGLGSGYLIDMLVCEMFTNKIPMCSKCHDGESDIVINNIRFNLKKITSKSTIALDWSKNPTSSIKSYFDCHFLIINLNTSKWWKTTNINSSLPCTITFNDEIPSGIYLIDKSFCKKNVITCTNNKSNTVINSKNLYMMLKRSIVLNLYIRLPDVTEILEFNILNAFT